MKTRALALAAGTVMAVAVLLAGGVATAAANGCVTPVVAIQSPANLAPTAGTVTVQATADSGSAAFTVTDASLTVLDSSDATVGGTPVLATVGATTGGAPTVYPITVAFNTGTLADGQYTLAVSASGCPAGKATVKILVDNTKPSLSFTSGPAEGATLASNASAAFGFASANDLTGPVTFQCAYDAAALGVCGSPSAATILGFGQHSFRVVGTDRAGNAAVIMRGFSVGAPPDPVDASSTSDQPTAKAKCRVPRLRGLTLAAARRKLRRAHCRLGRLSKPPKRVLALPVNRGQKLVVQRQSERAGARRPNGQKVGIALVPERDMKLS